MPFNYYLISNTASVVIAAVLLDALLGEPSRFHPLAGFGQLANHVERLLNKDRSSPASRIIGLLSWLLLLTPFVMLGYFLTHAITNSLIIWLTNVLLLYFSIGARSLTQHAQQIYVPLSQHNLDEARHTISMIVSRDTNQLNENEIATATVESVLENGNDAIFGAIFWFILLGGAGTLMFRLANTLDAMWGYKTPRFLHFGWAAARIDDLLNLIPARLTALSYALCGHTISALRCWSSQARTWYSPNAGPVMATGAGALQIKLGGAAVYHGVCKQRPILGLGKPASTQDILRAIRLINHSLWLWCVVIVITTILGEIYFA